MCNYFYSKSLFYLPHGKCREVQSHLNTHSDTPLSVGLLSPDNTQHSQQTDIQAPGTFESAIPKRLAADPRRKQPVDGQYYCAIAHWCWKVV
jgi:hypothetical protein